MVRSVVKATCSSHPSVLFPCVFPSHFVCSEPALINDLLSSIDTLSPNQRQLVRVMIVCNEGDMIISLSLSLSVSIVHFHPSLQIEFRYKGGHDSECQLMFTAVSLFTASWFNGLKHTAPAPLSGRLA